MGLLLESLEGQIWSLGQQVGRCDSWVHRGWLVPEFIGAGLVPESVVVGLDPRSAGINHMLRTTGVRLASGSTKTGFVLGQSGSLDLWELAWSLGP